MSNPGILAQRRHTVEPIDPLLWSTTEKTAGWSVAGGQKTATRGGSGVQNLASTLYRSSGRKYCEVGLNSGAGGTNAYDPSIHVCGVGFGPTLTNLPGSGSSSWALLRSGTVRFSSANSAYQVGWGNGSVIGIAVDFSTGELWFSVNGSWVGGGSPGAGATAAFTGIAEAVRPAVAANAGTASVTIRGTAAEFSYPIPDGFTAWSVP